nr:IkBL [Rattus norvegicus]
MSNPSPQAPEEEASTSPQSSMASVSRRHRRERRFRRYLSAGRLVRAQALLQRHPGLDVDAGQPRLSTGPVPATMPLPCACCASWRRPCPPGPPWGHGAACCCPPGP